MISLYGCVVEACGGILAELSETRVPPTRGLRQVQLPGLSLQLRELEDFDEDNFGAQVWTAAAWLSHLLCQSVSTASPSLLEPESAICRVPNPSGQTVLELGAGCGLCGIVCGYLGAEEVAITDLVPRLNDNIRHNIELQKDEGVRCRCYAEYLDWAEPEKIKSWNRPVPQGSDLTICHAADPAVSSGTTGAHGAGALAALAEGHQFDLIIGADLLLNAYSAVALLPRVISNTMAAHGKCVLSLAIRSTETLQRFKQSLQEAALECSIEDQTSKITEDVAQFDGWDSIKKYEGGIILMIIWHADVL